MRPGEDFLSRFFYMGFRPGRNDPGPGAFLDFRFTPPNAAKPQTVQVFPLRFRHSRAGFREHRSCGNDGLEPFISAQHLRRPRRCFDERLYSGRYRVSGRVQPDRKEGLRPWLYPPESCASGRRGRRRSSRCTRGLLRARVSHRHHGGDRPAGRYQQGGDLLLLPERG